MLILYAVLLFCTLFAVISITEIFDGRNRVLNTLILAGSLLVLTLSVYAIVRFRKSHLYQTTSQNQLPRIIILSLVFIQIFISGDRAPLFALLFLFLVIATIVGGPMLVKRYIKKPKSSQRRSL